MVTLSVREIIRRLVRDVAEKREVATARADIMSLISTGQATSTQD